MSNTRKTKIHRAQIDVYKDLPIMDKVRKEAKKWKHRVAREDCTSHYAFLESGVAYPYLEQDVYTAAWGLWQKLCPQPVDKYPHPLTWDDLTYFTIR